MTTKAEHIIHKLSVEINTDTNKKVDHIRNQSMSLAKETLIPIIEKVLDKFENGDTIRIDQLEITLESLNINNLETQIIQQIKKKLPIEIKKVFDDKKSVAVKHSTLDTFKYFLENGTLPWWYKQTSHENFERAILKDLKDNTSAFLNYSKVLNTHALDRFVLQFSDSFFKDLLKSQNAPKQFFSLIDQLQRDLSKDFSPRLIRNQIWKSVIATIFKQKFILKKASQEFLFNTIHQLGLKTQKSPKEILQVLIKTSKDNKLYNSISKINNPILKENDKNLDYQIPNIKSHNPPKEYYINNAGLIILHPFIKYLFKHLEFTKNNKFIDQHHQHQAALVLQYLCNGLAINPEYNLLLNKILCGISPDTPIENTLIISEEIKKESENLLKATINNWSALRKTSPQGLQTNFLNRTGKLSQKENKDWKLFIENKTLDILISKLPWSISIVKFPWMKNILWVDWA